jgi:hypothetical protein
VLAAGAITLAAPAGIALADNPASPSAPSAPSAPTSSLIKEKPGLFRGPAVFKAVVRHIIGELTEHRTMRVTG